MSTNYNMNTQKFFQTEEEEFIEQHQLGRSGENNLILKHDTRVAMDLISLLNNERLIEKNVNNFIQELNDDIDKKFVLESSFYNRQINYRLKKSGRLIKLPQLPSMRNSRERWPSGRTPKNIFKSSTGEPLKIKQLIRMRGDFLAYILEKFNKKIDNRYLVVRIETLSMEEGDVSKYYTVNNNLINFLQKYGNVYEQYDGTATTSVITKFEISYRKPSNGNQKREGGFFNYYLKEEYAYPELKQILRRYQIYNDGRINRNTKQQKFKKYLTFEEIKEKHEEGIINPKNVIKENCLIHSLRLAGVPEPKLKALKLEFRSSHIPLKYVKKFAEDNDYKIIVKTGDKRNLTYGKGENEIKLCLLENHYFIHENVDFSSFMLKQLVENPKLTKFREKRVVKKRRFYKSEIEERKNLKGDVEYTRKEEKEGNYDYELFKSDALQKDWQKITAVKQRKDCLHFERSKTSSNNSFRLVKFLLQKHGETSMLEQLKIDTSTLKIDNFNLIKNLSTDLDTFSSAFEAITSKAEKRLDDLEKPDLEDDQERNKLEKRRDILNDYRDSINTLVKDEKDKERFFKILKILENPDSKMIIRIGFDFETTTKKLCVPYLVSYLISINGIVTERKGSIVGGGCDKDFIREVHNHVLEMRDEVVPCKDNLDLSEIRTFIMLNLFHIELMAHNITFDIQFLLKHVTNYNPVYRANNKVCGGYFMYKGVKFALKDSYAITDSKLADFVKTFGIKGMKKEVMPYNLYDVESIRRNTMPIVAALRHLKTKEEKKEFLENIKKMDMARGNQFEHMRYAKFYCEQDVKIMMEGYSTFRSWVFKDLKINIDKFLTISSISDEYFKLNDVYEKCFLLEGVARHYIQRTVVGGRCMSRDNLKYFIKILLNDLDGVSLYPSAMKRLAEIGGYLQGRPSEIEEHNLNMKHLNTVSGYFVRVKILNFKSKRHFPLLSKVNDNGVRMFTKEVSEDDEYYLNKIAMEDLINFEKVPIENIKILDGYEFTEGRNPKIGEVIQNVFDTRIKYKSEKNNMQALYKLVMNSAYGKTILNENEEKISFFDTEEKAFSHALRNYNTVKEITKFHGCDKYLVKKSISVSSHQNACHIGSEILAMSKRIMNEVMCLAEDNGIRVFYQDTDSMHIEDGKIEELARLFKEKYGRELIGSKLGNFHCDFAPQFNSKGEELKPIAAVKTYILGKKSYMDIVKYKNEKDNTTTEILHARLKGIPNKLVNVGDENNIDEYSELTTGKRYSVTHGEKIYRDLLNGETIDFNILEAKPVFKMLNGGIESSSEFIRSVSFPGDFIVIEK